MNDKNFNDIIKQCCDLYNISENELYSKSRLRHLVDARTMVYYFLRNVMDYRYNQIAKKFGKNHATIIHAVKKHEQLMEWDIRYKDKYQTLQYQFIDRFPEKFEGNILSELKNENQQLKNQISELLHTINESNTN